MQSLSGENGSRLTKKTCQVDFAEPCLQARRVSGMKGGPLKVAKW